MPSLPRQQNCLELNTVYSFFSRLSLRPSLHHIPLLFEPNYKWLKHRASSTQISMSYVSKRRASVRLTYCSMLAPLKQIACNCAFGLQCSKGPSVCFCLRWQVYPYTAIASYRLCKSMLPTHTQLNANAVLMKRSTVCVSMRVCLLACIFHALFSVCSKTRGPPMWNWASLQRHAGNVLLVHLFCSQLNATDTKIRKVF